MEEYQVYITYKIQIEKWHAAIKDGKRPVQYIPYFQKHIKEILSESITFDRRILDCLSFALLHSHSNSLDPSHITTIAQQLQSIRFISYKDYIDVQGLAGSTIIHKGGEFIDCYKQLEIRDPYCIDREDMIRQLWLNVMKLSVSGFWRLVQLCQLKYPLLSQLYQITSICSQIKGIEKLEELIRTINENYSFYYQPRQIKKRPKQQISQKSIEQILKNYLGINTHKQNNVVSKPVEFGFSEKKEYRQRQRQEQESRRAVALIDRLRLQEEKIVIAQERTENYPFPSKPEQHFKNEERAQKNDKDPLKAALFSIFSRYQNIQEIEPVEKSICKNNLIVPKVDKQSTPHLLFKQYKELRIRSNNQLQRYFITIAYDNCLFYNTAFDQLINDTHSLVQCLKQISHQYGLDLGLFGSLRSKFALTNEFDIDLTFMGNKSRNEGTEVLDNFKTILIYNLQLEWIKIAYLLTNIPTLPPLMQIKVHEQTCKEIFSISIQKIDITACNDTAAINSQFLSHYAKIPEICLFCLLVKLWAKNANVINRYHPVEGLSSYGVILMCLYFLMQTNQINFLNYTPSQLRSITLGSLVPDISFVQCRAIDQNFLDFLDFYRARGRFHREAKIVCLLKNGHQGTNYRKTEYIFNMYDFIDNTNPGRVTYAHQRVLDQFQKAYYIVRDRDLRQIHNLLTVHHPLLKKKIPFKP